MPLPLLVQQVSGENTALINIVISALITAIGALFAALMWSFRSQISRLERQVDQRDDRDRTILSTLERTVTATYDALVKSNEATREFRQEIVRRFDRLDPPRGGAS